MATRVFCGRLFAVGYFQSFEIYLYSDNNNDHKNHSGLATNTKIDIMAMECQELPMHEPKVRFSDEMN